MSVLIRGWLACSVGPLKLRLRISSFGYLLLSWRSITGQNFKPGGLTNPEISRAGGICPHSVPTCGHTCRILGTLSPIPTKSFPRPKFGRPKFGRGTKLLFRVSWIFLGGIDPRADRLEGWGQWGEICLRGRDNIFVGFSTQNFRSFEGKLRNFWHNLKN